MSLEALFQAGGGCGQDPAMTGNVVHVYSYTGSGPGGAVNVQGRQKNVQAHGQVGPLRIDIRDDVRSSLGQGLQSHDNYTVQKNL